MTYVMPDYNKGLVNVASSILRYFGIEPRHKSLKALDEVLITNKYQNVVLFLFDGLGYNLLKDNKDFCSYLYKHLVGKERYHLPFRQPRCPLERPLSQD